VSILDDRCQSRLATLATADQLQAQLEALQRQNERLKAKVEDLDKEVQIERVGRLLAERRAVEDRQGGPRYARNVPTEWPRNEHKKGFE